MAQVKFVAQREILRFRAEPGLIKFIDDVKETQSFENRSEAIRFLLKLQQFLVKSSLIMIPTTNEAEQKWKTFMQQYNNKP